MIKIKIEKGKWHNLIKLECVQEIYKISDNAPLIYVRVAKNKTSVAEIGDTIVLPYEHCDVATILKQ